MAKTFGGRKEALEITTTVPNTITATLVMDNSTGAALSSTADAAPITKLTVLTEDGPQVTSYT